MKRVTATQLKEPHLILGRTNLPGGKKKSSNHICLLLISKNLRFLFLVAASLQLGVRRWEYPSTRSLLQCGSSSWSCCTARGRAEERERSSSWVSKQTETLGYLSSRSHSDLSLLPLREEDISSRSSGWQQQLKRAGLPCSTRGEKEKNSQTWSSQLAWANLPDRHGNQTFFVIG